MGYLHPVDVVNGQKNAMTVTVEKKSDNQVIITKIYAAVLHPDTNILLKNVNQSTCLTRAAHLNVSR